MVDLKKNKKIKKGLDGDGEISSLFQEFILNSSLVYKIYT
jgi:hypothetical protein